MNPGLPGQSLTTKRKIMKPCKSYNSPLTVITMVLIMFYLSAECKQITSSDQLVERDELILDEALVNGIVMGIPGISVAIGKGDSIVWTGTAGFTGRGSPGR